MQHLRVAGLQHTVGTLQCSHGRLMSVRQARMQVARTQLQMLRMSSNMRSSFGSPSFDIECCGLLSAECQQVTELRVLRHVWYNMAQLSVVHFYT